MLQIDAPPVENFWPRHCVGPVVKLLRKRLGGPKLELEGQRAEVGFSTADQGFSSIQGTVFRFYGISIVSDACNIYPHQARTNANDKITAKDCIFSKHHAQKKY